MGKRPENKISWKVLKIFAQVYSSDDLWQTLTFYGKVQFAFWSFVWKEFMELVQDFGAKVDKYS